jgi:hypothetical protein
MILHNKGFLNSPFKLPSYRNIFYISPNPLLPFSFFLSHFSSLVYISQKPSSFGSQLIGLYNFPIGVVDLKPTSKNKRVNKWGWINRKPSQKLGVGLDMPSLRNSKKAMYVRRLKMIVLAPT